MKVSQPRPRGSQFKSGSGDTLFLVIRLIKSGILLLVMSFYRDLFLVAVLGIGGALYSGCRTKEVIPPHLLFPSGVSVGKGIFPSQAETRQSELEKIVEGEPYVADIIYFHEYNKERLIRAMDEEYGTSRKSIERLWQRIAKKSKPHGDLEKDPIIGSALTLMPERCAGKRKKSILIGFDYFFQKNENDRKSHILHELKHAEDNYWGIYLNGKKILPEDIGRVNYGYLMELRATNDQLERIEAGLKVSDLCKYSAIAEYSNYYDKIYALKINGNKYAAFALDDTSYLPKLWVDANKKILIKKKRIKQEKPK